MFTQSSDKITNISTGQRTVSTTAAAIFAGASRLKDRFQMTVFNESDTTVYYGDSSVTVGTGFPLLSGDSATFYFFSHVPYDVYFIASASKAVRVVEVKG